jgi:hypothetical protein
MPLPEGESVTGQNPANKKKKDKTEEELLEDELKLIEMLP